MTDEIQHGTSPTPLISGLSTTPREDSPTEVLKTGPSTAAADESDDWDDAIVNVTPPPFALYDATTALRPGKAKGAQRKFEKRVPFTRLFRFADGFDITLIIIGILSGIGTGALMPFFMIYMGSLVDSFTTVPDLSGLFSSSQTFTLSTFPMSMITSSMARGMVTKVFSESISTNVTRMLILGAISFVDRKSVV